LSDSKQRSHINARVAADAPDFSQAHSRWPAHAPTSQPVSEGARATSLARFGAVLMVTARVAPGSGAYAQDLEPRAYANTPVGLNCLIAGYAYLSGSVATDPGLPVKDVHLQIHSAILAYVRSLAVWGKSGKVGVVLPYAWLSGSAEGEHSAWRIFLVDAIDTAHTPALKLKRSFQFSCSAVESSKVGRL
jgi:hypothetical protein